VSRGGAHRVRIGVATGCQHSTPKPWSSQHGLLLRELADRIQGRAGRGRAGMAGVGDRAQAGRYGVGFGRRQHRRRAVGVAGVRDLAGLVEVGEGAGLGGGHAAGQVDAGGAEAGAEEGAETSVERRPRNRGGAEPGEGDGDVGGAATGQGPQRELVGAGPDGVGEGVGDTLAEDGDADGGLGSGAMVTVCLSQEERGSRRAPEWVA